MDYGFRLPDDFLIGTANSAFQSEGAADRDGKSESIMDHYAKEIAGKDVNTVAKTARVRYTEDLPDRGCFFYDNYEEYIEDMKKTGQNVYRMSIAWTRIIPSGIGEVNQLGINHYNKVIDKLLSCGITPFVDLYHWDLPMCLQEKGGFANPDFPEWFEAYAKVCFEAFGDRVKLWSTFNETAVSIMNGYIGKAFPPFISDYKTGHLAGHHVLIAHFRAVRLYKSMNLGGQIGAVNCFTDMSPETASEEDNMAVQIRTERQFDWWTEPMLKGTYPEFILEKCPSVRESMPDNYAEELKKWFIPMDFIGLNYYLANIISYDPNHKLLSKAAENYFAAPGQVFNAYPPGLIDVVQYIKRRYGDIPIYITENGCAIDNINDKEKEIDDIERVVFLREHLRNCVRLIRDGYNLKGYMYWNDADSYEELDGYHIRFGLTWVDHKTGERAWKKSREYFSKVCKDRMVD